MKTGLGEGFLERNVSSVKMAAFGVKENTDSDARSKESRQGLDVAVTFKTPGCRFKTLQDLEWGVDLVCLLFAKLCQGLL